MKSSPLLDCCPMYTNFSLKVLYCSLWRTGPRLFLSPYWKKIQIWNSKYVWSHRLKAPLCSGFVSTADPNSPLPSVITYIIKNDQQPLNSFFGRAYTASKLYTDPHLMKANPRRQTPEALTCFDIQGRRHFPKARFYVSLANKYTKQASFIND